LKNHWINRKKSLKTFKRDICHGKLPPWVFGDQDICEIVEDDGVTVSVDWLQFNSRRITGVDETLGKKEDIFVSFFGERLKIQAVFDMKSL